MVANESVPARRRQSDRWGGNSRIVGTVFLTFVGYLTIGLPLAVLPIYVRDDLGYGSVMAGLAVSIQYIATVLTRAQVGQIIDTRGPKPAVVWGLAACFGSGALLLTSAMMDHFVALSLGFLFASRLALGVAEGLVGIGAIGWAIGRVGPTHTARIISWNGVSSYGALAAGAPTGVYLVDWFGFGVIGVSVMLLAVVGLAVA